MLAFAFVSESVSPMLALLVFAAELCVVTLSTIRIIFVARGMKGLASVLGFFEVSIWLFAIGQIMQNLSNVGCYLGFAAGFTLGNYLGIYLEKRLAIGTLVLQTITHRDAEDLINRFKLAGYGVTSVDGQGATGPVRIVFTVIKRKDLPSALALVREFDSNAFYAVNELKEATGIPPLGQFGRRVRIGNVMSAVHSSRANQTAEPAAVESVGVAKRAA